MATQAAPRPAFGRDERFFLKMAVAMALTIVAGFSFQLATGRSTFAAPPLVHAHALVFFGWVALYLAQNVLVTRGSMTLHRRLGWLSCGWALAIMVLGIYTTIATVRRGTSPFFFEPAYFLVMNALSVLCFGALTAAAIMFRRQTAWHRRLLYCGMAVLTGPAFGRLLPLPLMIPHAGWAVFAAVMIWPAIGVIADRRRRGTVHRGWWWGIGAITTTQIAMSLIAYSPLGVDMYEAAVQGYPGAATAPLDFSAPPTGPLVTAR